MQIVNHNIYTSSFLFIAVLAFYSVVVILVVYAMSSSKQIAGKLKTVLCQLVYVLCSITLFFTTTAIEPSAITRAAIIIISIAVAVGYPWTEKSFIEKYPAGRYTAALILLSFYSSFASFGYRFFLFGDNRPRFSLIGFLYCVLGTIWFFPLLKTILCLIGTVRIKKRPATSQSQKNTFVFWVLFLVLALCQGIVLFSFWPGVFPSDCTDQISQAIGIRRLNDWHPIIHTLFFRGVISVFNSAGMITAIQMLFFVLVCSLILMEGYYAGISPIWLCLGGALFILLPNQVFSSILTEKDFLYSVALLYGTWSVYRISISDRGQRLFFYIFFAADMFLIATLRHNGIVPFGFTALICTILAIKRKKQGIPLVASVISAALLLLVYKGPLFDILNVIPNAMKPYDIMFCAAGSCINKDLPLSEKSSRIMSRIMPQEEWKTYYSRFSGHDAYIWGGGSGMDMSDISASDAFYVYFDALTRYPDVVIKDRLDGTNLLWDITQPRDGYNYKAIDGIDFTVGEFNDLFDYSKLSKEDGGYYNRSKLSELYRKTIDIPPDSGLDMLLWRSGAYLIILFILFTFWHAYHLRRMFLCSVPLLGNLTSLVLVMYHQSFRYVYAVQIQVVALLFLTIISSKSESNTETIIAELQAGKLSLNCRNDQLKNWG